MKLWVYSNGALYKERCAAFVRPIPYNETELPLTQNGAILTGKYPNGKCLVVIDLDIEKKGVGFENFVETMFPKTFMVETGSGGLHIFLWVTDEIIYNRAFKFTKLTDKAKAVGIKEIDVRGEGGIIFAPGCKFKDHEFMTCPDCREETRVMKWENNKCPICHAEHIGLRIRQGSYRIVKNRLIKEITGEMFGKIFMFLIVQEDKMIQTNILEPPKIYALKGVTIKLEKPMRRGFYDILSGKFIIGHEKQQQTGVEEFLYWSAFWREYLSCGGNLDECINFFNKNKTQPEFDEETTKYQLTKVSDLNKRPSRDLYFKLFPWFHPRNIFFSAVERFQMKNTQEEDIE